MSEVRHIRVLHMATIFTVANQSKKFRVMKFHNKVTHFSIVSHPATHKCNTLIENTIITDLHDLLTSIECVMAGQLPIFANPQFSYPFDIH